MRVRFVAGVWATLATTPAIAATHHHNQHATHHASHAAHHAAPSRHASKTPHHAASHTDKTHAGKTHGASKTHGSGKLAAAPGGAIPVGSGGTRLFCAGHASPLLVRKATQGSGTTVTVICR